jgi:hypothetical protein
MDLNEVNPEERVKLFIKLMDLVSAGDDMRTHQKRFFRTREPKALRDSREAEANFDRILADILKPNSQTKLF